MVDGSKGNGNGPGQLKLLNLFTNEDGLIIPINFRLNQLVVLKKGGKVVEFMGIVKGGKSKHIELLCDNLRRDSGLTKTLGGVIDIAVFKSNSPLKVLYEKEPVTRAQYNEAIIHSHGLLLTLLHQPPKGYAPIGINEIDLAILDRGPNDDIVWTRALRDYNELISNDEKRAQLAMARNLEKYVDLAIGINVAPEVALGREGGKRQGNVMNLSFLRTLYPHYHELSQDSLTYGQPRSLDTPYLDIDGSGDKDENAQKIYTRIKGLFLPQETEELRSQVVDLEAITTQ